MTQHVDDDRRKKLDENNNGLVEVDAMRALGMGQDQEEDDGCTLPDMYHWYRLGENIPRTGKVFSYTFWRTKSNADVFWSVQGNNEMDGALGGIWIATQYFGNPQLGGRFLQEVTFTHPTETNVQMRYTSTLEEGRNCVFISKSIVHHFRKDDNSIDFDFKIVRMKQSRHRNRRRNLS